MSRDEKKSHEKGGDKGKLGEKRQDEYRKDKVK